MRRIILLISMVITFTACSGMGNKSSIINLLSAPKLSQTENEIVKAIDTYLGEDIVLKYSKTMGYAAPVQVADIDDDGDKEAIVLYYAPNKGTNIRLALLENKDGKWGIVTDEEGLGSEVFYFKITQMSKESNKQVLIGYSTPNIEDKFIAVYFLDANAKAANYSERCNEIAVGDLTEDGYDDIVIETKMPDTRTKLQILSLGEDNEFVVTGTHYLRKSAVTITQLKITKANGGKNALYIDYKDSYKKMYTEAGFFEEGKLSNILPSAYIMRFWDYSFDLNSTDIDRDGVMEIPTVIHDEAQDELPILKFVEWMDFSQGEPTRRYFGVCDTQTGLFMAMPDEWQGVINTIGDAEEWAITRVDDGEGIVMVKPVKLGDVPKVSEHEILTVKIGTRRWQIEFSDDVSALQREYIINSMATVD